MRRALPRLEPCLVQARRRDPNLRQASIEFVVSTAGKVLASRIKDAYHKDMRRCLRRTMKSVRFPGATGRTVATFTVTLP